MHGVLGGRIYEGNMTLLKMKWILLVSIALAFPLLSACNSEHMSVSSTSDSNTGMTPGGGGNTTGVQKSQVGYNDTVQPIFQQRCSICHNSSSSIPNWMDYATAFQFRSQIYQKVVVEKSMPLNNATQMTDAERNVIAEWVNAGAPEQGTTAAPSPTSAPSGDQPAPPSNNNPVPTPTSAPAPSPVASATPNPNPSPTDSAPGSNSGITYISTIQPLFQNRCAMCHGSSAGALNWLVYSNVIQHKDAIYQKVVVDKTMPLGNATHMTDDERATVGQWIQAGAPEGSSAPAPMPNPSGGSSGGNNGSGGSPVIYPPLTNCFHQLTVDLVNAAGGGDDAEVAHLLNLGACVNDRVDNSNPSALIFAVTLFNPQEASHYLATVQDLLTGGANANDSFVGGTPLQYAVLFHDSVDIAKSLIQKGADVNARVGKDAKEATDVTDPIHGKVGYTPLMLAVRNADVDMSKLLITSKADVNAVLPDGSGPFTMVCAISDLQKRNEILAALNSGQSTPKQCHVFATLDQELLSGLTTKTVTVLDQLIAEGASPNAGASQGKSALIRAVFEDEQDVAMLLVRNGADVNAKVAVGSSDDLAPFNGYTPLMLAIENQSVDLVEFLLAHGADRNVKAPDGTTPLSLAKSVLEGNYEKDTITTLLTQSQPALSFAKDVGPIIFNRCSMCHNASWKAANWTDYATAFNNRKAIFFRISEAPPQNRMPPIGNIYGAHLTPEEQKTLLQWIETGANP